MNSNLPQKSKKQVDYEKQRKDFESWVKANREDMTWWLEAAEKEMMSLDHELDEESSKFTHDMQVFN